MRIPREKSDEISRREENPRREMDRDVMANLAKRISRERESARRGPRFERGIRNDNKYLAVGRFRQCYSKARGRFQERDRPKRSDAVFVFPRQAVLVNFRMTLVDLA